MIQIKQIEKQYLKLYESEIMIPEFEAWLYENEEIIREETKEELYDDLILINFKSKEAKHELSKVLKINYDLLFRFGIQVKLNENLACKDLEIRKVEYQMLFDLNRLSFSFEIGKMNFLMNNPFDDEKFVQLTDHEKETKFKELFKSGRHFLNILIEAIETEKMRIWNSKLTEQMDAMTETKLLRRRENEFQIIIQNNYTFIEKKYLEKKIKEAWL